jgi:hypothetical protein
MAASANQLRTEMKAGFDSITARLTAVESRSSALECSVAALAGAGGHAQSAHSQPVPQALDLHAALHQHGLHIQELRESVQQMAQRLQGVEGRMQGVGGRVQTLEAVHRRTYSALVHTDNHILTQGDGPLLPPLGPDGTVPAGAPVSVAALLALSGTEAQALLQAYGRPVPRTVGRRHRALRELFHVPV